LLFQGWKNERVVTIFPDGARVIQVIKGDSSLWWRRVQEVLALVDFDLGFAKDEKISQSNHDKMVILIEVF